MRHIRPLVIVLVAAELFLLGPSGDSGAVPGGAAGPPFTTFSVRDIGPAPDITGAISASGLTCASADILTPPGTGPGGPCALVAPRPAGPIPDGVTNAFPDLGLDGAGIGTFFDDLDALSWGDDNDLLPIALLNLTISARGVS